MDEWVMLDGDDEQAACAVPRSADLGGARRSQAEHHPLEDLVMTDVDDLKSAASEAALQVREEADDGELLCFAELDDKPGRTEPPGGGGGGGSGGSGGGKRSRSPDGSSDAERQRLTGQLAQARAKATDMARELVRANDHTERLQRQLADAKREYASKEADAAALFSENMLLKERLHAAEQQQQQQQHQQQQQQQQATSAASSRAPTPPPRRYFPATGAGTDGDDGMAQLHAELSAHRESFEMLKSKTQLQLDQTQYTMALVDSLVQIKQRLIDQQRAARGDCLPHHGGGGDAETEKAAQEELDIIFTLKDTITGLAEELGSQREATTAHHWQNSVLCLELDRLRKLVVELGGTVPETAVGGGVAAAAAAAAAATGGAGGAASIQVVPPGLKEGAERFFQAFVELFQQEQHQKPSTAAAAAAGAESGSASQELVG